MSNLADFTPDDSFRRMFGAHWRETPPAEKDTPMTDLKIEAGKSYETSGGFRAYIAFQDEHGDWHGILRQKCGIKMLTWTSKGKLHNRLDLSADLISEWKEPRKGEVDFREFFERRNVGVSFPNRLDDYPSTAFERLAETLADFVDERMRGQGLDGEGGS